MNKHKNQNTPMTEEMYEQLKVLHIKTILAQTFPYMSTSSTKPGQAPGVPTLKGSK